MNARGSSFATGHRPVRQDGGVSTPSDNILELCGISKRFGDTVALDGIDLAVRRGEFLTLLGPSGSGKTTTLNLIAGFAQPSAGSIQMNDKLLDRVPPEDRNLGVVFQHYALFPHLTVAQNIEYPLRQRKIPRAERRARVTEALAMVRLEGAEDRRPSELSGGQQQRVAVARALVYRPPILLMDEPLGALDKSLRGWLQTELRRIHHEVGSTFIYVTHDQGEALALSDRIAVFNAGRIEQIGTPRELYREPESLFVAEFVGDSSLFPDTDGEPVLVRPEHIEVLPVAGGGDDRDSDAAVAGTGSGSTNRVPGAIRNLTYLGAQVKITAATDRGAATALVDADRAAQFAVDDPVIVAWRESDAIRLRGATKST